MTTRILNWALTWGCAGVFYLALVALVIGVIMLTGCVGQSAGRDATGIKTDVDVDAKVEAALAKAIAGRDASADPFAVKPVIATSGPIVVAPVESVIAAGTVGAAVAATVTADVKADVKAALVESNKETRNDIRDVEKSIINQGLTSGDLVISFGIFFIGNQIFSLLRDIMFRKLAASRSSD